MPVSDVTGFACTNLGFTVVSPCFPSANTDASAGGLLGINANNLKVHRLARLDKGDCNVPEIFHDVSSLNSAQIHYGVINVLAHGLRFMFPHSFKARQPRR